MRITRSAVGMLLTMSALAVSDQTQVVTPFEMPAGYKQRLDHAVPVATVTRMGQPIALAGAKAVTTAMEPFMLGPATLDLRVPSHATLVFTMTNATDTPILRHNVLIEEYSVTVRADDDEFLFPTIGGHLESPESRTTWRPGETITVQLPISPVPEGARLQAFIVLIQSVDTPRRADGEKELLRAAFERISKVRQ